MGEVPCDNCCNEEQNYFHLMGLASRETGDWGKTRFQSDRGYLPWCLMHVDSEPLANRTDGVDRFCCYNLLADPTLCSSDVTQCGEGLRVTTDPK